MRRIPDLLLYIAVFVLFGSVLLWVQSAGWPLLVFGAFASLLIAGLAAFADRHRTVLVVGEPSASVASIDDALEEAGYDVRSCAGPANRPCPVLQGRRCPLGERPIAALVYRPAIGGRYAPCGSEFRIPSVIVEERLVDEPEPIGSYARVGLDHGADHVVRVMQGLLVGEPIAAAR
jgi:hypothetical protein